MLRKSSIAVLALVVLAQLCAALAGNRGWLVDVEDKKSAMALAAARRARTASVRPGEQLSEVQEWWDDFKEYYNKQYATQQEEARAFQNFKAAMERVHAINSDPQATFWASGNAFADLDFETFKKQYLNARPPKAAPSGGGRKLLSIEDQQEIESQGYDLLDQGDSVLPIVRGRQLITIPAYVNWTKWGRVTPVKNQGGCGSCWAFSGTSTIESAYLISQGTTWGKTPIDLSEQQLVSCSTGSAGCQYGGTNDAIDYVYRFNQSLEVKWRYSGVTGTCGASQMAAATKRGTVVQLASTYMRPQGKNYTALMEAATKQPVAVYIAADANFMYYRGGVFKPESYPTYINHAVVVTGFNKTSKQWFIKNSWGTGWGEKGYARIHMTTSDPNGINGMYQYAFFPPLKFKQVLSNNTLTKIRAGLVP